MSEPSLELRQGCQTAGGAGARLRHVTIMIMTEHIGALEAWFTELNVSFDVEVTLDRVLPVGPDRDQPNEKSFLNSMTAYAVRLRLTPDARRRAVDLVENIVAALNADNALGGRLTSGVAHVTHADWNHRDAPGRLAIRVIVTER
jgi:hypothetical protein